MKQHERNTQEVIAHKGDNPQELVSYILHLDQQVTRWQAATLGWAAFGCTMILTHAVAVWTGSGGSITSDIIFGIFAALVVWGLAK